MKMWNGRVKGSAWQRVVGASLLGAVLLTGSPAMAGETSENVALEVTSWLLTAPYGAFKAAYALGGTAVGGLVWLGTGGDTKIAKSVWIPAVTGDYIVRPENLSGERPINFVGKGA